MQGLTKLANHLTVFYVRIITRDTFHVPGIYDTHYTGVCMLCKETPSREKTVTCITCVTPWHMNCLENPPVTSTSVVNFECPYCAGVGLGGASLGGELVAKIREIEADISMTEEEKSRKRQDIVCGKQLQINENENEEAEDEERDVLALLGESIKCLFCYMLPDRPVTTSCGHNFCLKCFKKWIGQGKETCVKCRSQISSQMINQPLINSALVTAIRMAKESRKNNAPRRPQAAYPQANQDDRPDNPFIREGAAKRAGMANASSGRIFVAIPSDHFGPILAENDPERNQGVLVGDSWTHRLNCRQWGVHWPHVAGIAGQAKYGAQSVVLSGGYEDDEDHGEWFLYTGRSHKEKRSSYAPQEGLRYDGVYRIDKCWRKLGKQGYKMCRYLFVRCDNEPAPWMSDGHGDKPRPLPEIPELEEALDIFERTDTPSWDYDDGEDKWKWKKPSPPSQQRVIEGSPKDGKRARKTPRKLSLKQTLLKGFSCVLCKNVLTQPVTTLCAHNFCKGCLEEAFKGQAFVKERECHNGRKLRSKKNFMKCPSCSLDISEFLQNPQVNRELEDAIGKLLEEFHESDNDKEDVK